MRGIGLSVVRKLVEMHGGSVQAFSEGKGRGSEFVVTLPLAAKRSTNHSAEDDVIQSVQLKWPDNNEALDSSQGKPRRILVVDDNEDAALMLATLS